MAMLLIDDGVPLQATVPKDTAGDQRGVAQVGHPADTRRDDWQGGVECLRIQRAL